MIININKKYRIITDDLQYIIQRSKGMQKKDTKRRKAGEVIWQNEWYYPTLNGVITAILALDLRGVDNETLTEALDRQKVLVAELSRALAPQYEVVEREVNG